MLLTVRRQNCGEVGACRRWGTGKYRRVRPSDVSRTAQHRHSGTHHITTYRPIFITSHISTIHCTTYVLWDIIDSFHVSSSGRDHYILLTFFLFSIRGPRRSPGETQPNFTTGSWFKNGRPKFRGKNMSPQNCILSGGFRTTSRLKGTERNTLLTEEKILRIVP